MTNPGDLAGTQAFVEEAAGYLPLVRQALDEARHAGSAPTALGEAHRLVHTIRTGAATVGEISLSANARELEDELERRVTVGQALDVDTVDRLWAAVEIIESDLLATFADVRGQPEMAADDDTRSSSAADAAAVDSVIAAELLDVFGLEAQEHLAAMAAALKVAEHEPGDQAALGEIRRSMHTLKGAAAMVGLRDVGRLAHRAEDLLDAVAAGAVQPSGEVTAVLFAATDGLHDLIAGEALSAAAVSLLETRFEALVGAAGDAAAASKTADVTHQPVERRRTGTPDRRSGDDRRGGQQVVRVPVERIDELVALLGELVVSRTAFEEQLTGLSRQVGGLDESLGRLAQTWSRFEAESIGTGGLLLAGGDTGEVASAVDPGPAPETPYGFDELEFDRYTEWHVLSRKLTETAGDLAEGQREIRASLLGAEREFARLRRSSRELQDKLMRLRMVPLGTLESRLSRIVRVTAEEQGRQVDMVVEGADVALDKPLLDRLADPLLHLLRNAVDHGMERPEERLAAGKPERGTITVRARYDGAQAVVEVADDGTGIDHDALRAAAIRRGWLSEAEAGTVPLADLEEMIFEPGFTTRLEVSDVSGRGVGLDVVRQSVAELSGTLTVSSEPGYGSTFTLRLPRTLALTRVLMVEAGRQTFAIPLAAIEQTARVGTGDLATTDTGLEIRLPGGEETRPAIALAAAMGLRCDPDAATPRAAVVLSGPRRVALLVDHLLDTREVVVRLLDRGLAGVPGLAGATILPDGRVVLILEPDGVVRSAAADSPSDIRSTTERDAPKAIRVLIADDSLSVRHVLSNVAARAGWTAIPARDGLEALELLTAVDAGSPPDVVLSDIEMPGMDGYELTSAIRADPRLRDTPVVFITSRSGEKHRARAAELGVDDYLVKPFEEGALVDLVSRLATRKPGPRRSGNGPPGTRRRRREPVRPQG